MISPIGWASTGERPFLDIAAAVAVDLFGSNLDCAVCEDAPAIYSARIPEIDGQQRNVRFVDQIRA